MVDCASCLLLPATNPFLVSFDTRSRAAAASTMGLTTAEIVLNYVCPAMGGLMASVMFAGA